MASLLDFLLGQGTPVATDAQGQVTGPAAPPQGGLLGGLSNFLGNNSDRLTSMGMGMLSGANQAEGFQNAMLGMQRGAVLDRQREQLRQAQMDKLTKQKAAREFAQKYPQYAGMLQANPELASQFAKAQFEDQLDPNKKRLQAAQADYYSAKARDAQRSADNPNADETFGVQPIWGTDPSTGKPALVQVGNKGTIRRAPIPEGVDISGGIEKIDTGTSVVLRDKRTGAVIGTEPKDVAGAAAAKEEGAAAGKASANLPQTEMNARWLTKHIQDTLNHPGTSDATGWGAIKQAIPGTDAYGFKARVAQLQGNAFLQAYQGLRGTGSISEAEGAKAEQAQARLNSAQTEKDFREALQEMAQVVQEGLQVERQKASGNFRGQTPGASKLPGVGQSVQIGGAVIKRNN